MMTIEEYQYILGHKLQVYFENPDRVISYTFNQLEMYTYRDRVLGVHVIVHTVAKSNRLVYTLNYLLCYTMTKIYLLEIARSKEKEIK